MSMDRGYLPFILNTGLIICIFSVVIFMPLFPSEAQSQYSETSLERNKLQFQQVKLAAEMEAIRAELINLMAETVKMITEQLEELILNFNKYFKLVPETEESETATSTATTTEEILEQTAYSSGQSSLPQTPLSCPLPVTGRLVYTVSSANDPAISLVTLDPGNVEYNTVQAIMVNVADGNGLPITLVVGKVTTDDASYPVELALKSGTETNGIWQGSWTLKDSICRQFTLEITAHSGSGSSNVVISIR